MRRLVLYTRKGCCLCDEARAVIERIQAEAPSAVVMEERDIDADDALHRAYLERIPVVTIDGEEAFELFVHEPDLRRRLGIVQAG